MNTGHNTTASGHSPRLVAPRARLTRRTALSLLYAALALQVAAWISVVLTVGSLKPTFTQPHPGFRAGIIVGGGIWLVQFAAAVIVSHIRSRHQNR